MKKIMALLLTVGFIIGISAVSMAAATFSGEIDVGYQGWQQNQSGFFHHHHFHPLGNTEDAQADYVFGKMVLNGKLGEDLTGTLVFKDADTKYSSTADNMSNLAVDEASVTFTEDWGSLKLGYFGWNNNLKDILDVWTDDIKSQSTIAFSTPLTDNINLGLAFAYTGTGYGSVHDPWINDGTVMASSKIYWNGHLLADKIMADTNHPYLWGSASNLDNAEAYKNAFSADHGFTGGVAGGDLLYYHYNDNDTAWGINAFVQLGDFKPFVEYRNFQSNAIKSHSYYLTKFTTIEPYNLINCIVGFTYEPVNIPFYMRAEVDLNPNGFFSWSRENSWGTQYYYNTKYTYSGNPWGARIGYKLDNGAKIEAQYFHTGFDTDEALWYFIPNTVTAPQNKYYLKLICPF